MTAERPLPAEHTLDLTEKKTEENKRSELEKVLRENLFFSPTAFDNAIKQLDRLLGLNGVYAEKLKAIGKKLGTIEQELYSFHRYKDEELEDDELKTKQDLLAEQEQVLKEKHEILETQNAVVKPDFEKFIQTFTLPKNLTIEDLDLLREISYQTQSSLISFRRIEKYLSQPDHGVASQIRNIVELPADNVSRQNILDEIHKYLFVSKKLPLSAKARELLNVADMSVEAIDRETKRPKQGRREFRPPRGKADAPDAPTKKPEAILETAPPAIKQLKPLGYSISEDTKNQNEPMPTHRGKIALENRLTGSKIGHRAFRTKYDTDASAKRTNQEESYSTHSNRGKRPKYKTEEEKRNLKKKEF